MPDQTERLTKLIGLLLETSRPLSFEEIADDLRDQYVGTETARRGAFERDKSVLRSTGVPLYTEVLSGERAGATAYRILRSQYELPDLGLTGDEKHALQLALAAVHLDEGAATAAMAKLGADEGGVVAVTANLPDQPNLSPLFEANVSRVVASFAYRGRARLVEPWGLLVRNGFWYVVGLDRAVGEQRVFRVDRIEGGVTVHRDQEFERPEGFDAQAAVTTDAKRLGDGVPAEALVLVDAARAGKVVGETGDDAVVERRDDGSVVVRVPCTNLPAFRSWVIGLLEHAEVLEPADVRADLVAWLRALT
jgi:proteasome accessory factor B